MKKICAILLLILPLGLISTEVVAQSTSGGTKSTSFTWVVPHDMAVKVLKAACPWYETHCGGTFSDLYAEYQAGTAIVEFVSKDASGYTFRVTTGGGSMVLLVNSF